VNTSPENPRNLIGSVAVDNHRSWVLRYEFYSGAIGVVEVAERIRVDEPKNQGFAKNVTSSHGCRFKFRSARGCQHNYVLSIGKYYTLYVLCAAGCW
jgi:hypothetical protein